MKIFKKAYIMLLLAFLFYSCSSLKTAIYDQYSYQKTIEIKIEAVNLMDKATNPYNDYLKEIGELGLEIEKITEYEKNKPNNDISYEMWKILSDQDKNLLVGFFRQWKEKNESQTLNKFFIDEAKIQIVEAMNLLIEYEAKKDKEIENKLLELITQ